MNVHLGDDAEGAVQRDFDDSFQKNLLGIKANVGSLLTMIFSLF